MAEQESILIVDDDPGTCKTLSLILDRLGYETDVAATGQEALSKVSRRFFNVVLLDIKLPDMEGLELLTPLRNLQPDTVVIVATAYATLETAVQALNEGAAAYITKPLNMDEALATLRHTLERQRLQLENRRLLEQLRNLARYLQSVREEERTRIAREIHDEFGQMLTALKMDLAWLSKRLPAAEIALAGKANEMSTLIDAALQLIRRVATELRPGLLDDLGLSAALEWQTQEFADRTGIDYELDLAETLLDLDRDLATTIFRIFQETLTNVARHANASKILIRLEQQPDKLILTVHDNGQGITNSQISDPKSLGLIGIRERARAWAGDVTFAGLPGQGTTIVVTIPWKGGRANHDQSAGSR